MFVVRDEWHADDIGEFDSRAEAHAELQRLADIPWNEAPNLCPCRSWRTCGRSYHIIEYDTSGTPWRQISYDALLDVSAKATVWLSTSETGNHG